MGESISLEKISRFLKKNLKIIVSSTVIIALLVAVYSIFIITPIYEASSQIIVNERENKQTKEFDPYTIQTNVELINTYNVIITSPAILDDVNSELQLDYSAEELTRKIFVSSEEDSQVVTITVEDSNQATATKIANEVVTIFQKKIPDIMNVDNVSVLTTAEEKTNSNPIFPNVKLNIAIGAILGLLLGVALSFLLEYFDTSIKTKDDIEKKLAVPVIGMIPTVETSDLKSEKNLSQRSQEKYA